MTTSLIPQLALPDLEKVGYFVRPEDAGALLHLTNPDARSARSVIIYGEPGVGKTQFAKSIADAIRTKAGLCAYHEILTHSWLSDEELFASVDVVRMQVARTQETVDAADLIVKGILWKAAEDSMAGPTVLLLDEFDKCQPRTETLLLGFLQDGRVQGSQSERPVDGTSHTGEVYANLHNLIVVITSNRAREFYDATMDRSFAWYMNYLEPRQEITLLRSITSGAPNAVISVVSTANIMRGRGQPCSVRQMSALLVNARRATSVSIVATLVKGHLCKRGDDLTPEEVSALADTLFKEFEKDKGKIK